MSDISNLCAIPEFDAVVWMVFAVPFAVLCSFAESQMCVFGW